MSFSFLRVTPHSFSILPPHPSLDSQPARPLPHQFVHSVLEEAHAFLSSIPTTFHRDQKPRTSAPSTAKVQLSTRTAPSQSTNKERPQEFWACRTSVHQNAPVHGTASWEEFQSGLRDNHAENEMAYTPSITAIERLLTWPIEREVEGGWKEVEMQVNVITHTFHPTILIRSRTFITLAISAILPDSYGKGFMTVQTPLNHDPGSEPLRQTILDSVPRNTIFASYASIEQIQLHVTPDQIEWIMATTSDAGGAIPQWVQRSWTMGGVPKAIVADVGLFIEWTSQRRVSREGH